MASEEAKRIGRSSLIAWIAMIALMAVSAGVKWNQPGYRDLANSSPLELAATVAVVMAVPLFLSTSVLATLTLLADRWLRGRLTLAANTLVGASLGALNAIGFLAAGNLVPGDTMRLTPAALAIFLPVLTVGGIVTSLGMRRR